MSLFWRIFLLNAAVLTAATILLVLAPVTVSASVVLTEVLVLTAGLIVMLVANAVLLRIGLAPLRRLARTMTTIDLLRPGSRPRVTGGGGIADLIRTFNTMLDRLENERTASTARVLSAQEAERRRISQELHDEVGQSLTAVLLELKRLADEAPSPVAEELRQVQESTRESLDEIRRLARRLRPGVLEELGLISALKALTTEIPAHSGLDVRCQLDNDLPSLSEEAELVLYRIAQESITNTVRHARATRLELTLHHDPTGVRLRIRDDGRGLGTAPEEGAGLRGMRERALLVGAEVTIGPSPDSGTEVCLHVPVRSEDRGT